VTIEVLTETGSTNADLLARLREGRPLPEGDWLVADRQTAGRGRLGRTWSDGAGNFMGSTLVRRLPGDPPAQTLAFVAGLAVHAACAKVAPMAGLELKWPNDVMAHGAKLAGMLLESQADRVVVGIGVNLAKAPEVPDRKTTSLDLLGATVSRDDFANDLADSFAAELSSWRLGGLAPVLRRWQARAHPLGAPLAVQAGGDALIGKFAGLAEDGGLQLRLADGTTRIIHSGEVMPAAGHP
jgi:BirA family biotin operon repressor/biotin-[acetyl-CoA-carboxylase] ligase